MDELFKQNLNPKTVVLNLSIHAGFNIQPVNDLIILDEIQSSNSALNSLKYFNEKNNEYHIAAAGSLLGILLSGPSSFPVGKVNFVELHPLTFLEFLDAMGKNTLRELIESTADYKQFPIVFHEELNRLLRIYFFTGGMPEVVKEYAQTENLIETRVIQKEIINSFILDFAKHSITTDITKINKIWESIPYQLAKENKKFIFSVLHSSARAREYENAIQWLVNTGLIHKSYQVNTVRFPLNGYWNSNIFKVYSVDVGILGAMANLQANVIINGDNLFTEFKGALVENYVAQQLIGHSISGGNELYYWKNNGKAEIDFLIECENRIIPLEVKAGINLKSKSLAVYRNKFLPDIMVRMTLQNLKKDGDILNIPLYAIRQLPTLIHG